MLPDEVTVLQNQGVEVIVEWLAGERAFAADKDYLRSGASIADRNEVVSKYLIFCARINVFILFHQNTS